MNDENLSILEEQMKNLNLDVVYNEGIKEKIESLIENDVYNKYGELIAKGLVDFDLNILDDFTYLVKVVSKYSKDTTKTLEW